MILTELLKYARDKLDERLLSVSNTCGKHKKIPKTRCDAHIIPIFKKGKNML